MPPARLLTIPFSHYCEKARWAADHVGMPYVEEPYLPGFHVRPARAAGGRTVPILVLEGRAFTDSADIVQHCAAVAPPERRLYPEDEAAREEARRIEVECDKDLGVATRLLAYYHGLPHAFRFTRILRPSLTATQAVLLPIAFTLLASRIRQMYGLTRESADRAEASARAVFEGIGTCLAGKPFLSGSRFGAADITFAALASPLILPPGHPMTVSSVDGIPPTLRDLVVELRATPAGAHVMRMYREFRRL